MQNIISIEREGAYLHGKITAILIPHNEGMHIQRVYQDLLTQLFMYFVEDPYKFAVVIRNLPSYSLLEDLSFTRGHGGKEIANAFKEVAMHIYMRLSNDPSFPLAGHDHILKYASVNTVVIESLPITL